MTDHCPKCGKTSDSYNSGHTPDSKDCLEYRMYCAGIAHNMERRNLLQLVNERTDALSNREAQIKQLITEISRLRTALQTIQNDFEKHNQSIGNYSDGEFTQDYTTRAAMVFNALENL